VEIQSHVIDLITSFFNSMWWPTESDITLGFRLYWTILTKIGCLGHYFYFSTDELKLWSCKISEISQSNLNINLIKQLTEKSKFNKIRKSMNSAQKSPNPNSQRQRLKVKWPYLPHFTPFSPHSTSFYLISPQFQLNFTSVFLISPHFQFNLTIVNRILPHWTPLNIISRIVQHLV